MGRGNKSITRQKGALLLRLSRNHAVAVIGIRHKKGDPGTAPQLQFLVANSLAMYDPKPEIPTRAVWADAKDLVSKTILRKADEVVSRDKLLVTWETHE